MKSDDNTTNLNPDKEGKRLERFADRAARSAWSSFVVGLVVALLLLLFNAVVDRYNIKKRLGEVPVEIWLTVFSSGAAGIFKWYVYREQEKVKLAQGEADATGIAIREMENQIDSLLIQIASIRHSLISVGEVADELKKAERSLDQKVDSNDYKQLQARLVTLEEIHDKYCFLVSQISHAKGMSEGSDRGQYDRLVRQLDLTLEQVALQLKGCKSKSDLREEIKQKRKLAKKGEASEGITNI